MGITLQSSVPFGMKVATVYIGAGSGAPATDIVLRGLDGDTFEVANALRTRIYDSAWGPAVNKRPVIAMWSTSERPIDTLVQGNWIYGMQASPIDSTTYHADGILIYCGNGIVIRNNIFGKRPDGTIDGNGGTGDLAIFYRTDPLFANILVEGNQAFSPPWAKNGDASYNVQYDSKIPGLAFRNNSFPKGMLDTGPGSLSAQAPPPSWPPA